jgi:hypothetical protein
LNPAIIRRFKSEVRESYSAQNGNPVARCHANGNHYQLPGGRSRSIRHLGTRLVIRTAGLSYSPHPGTILFVITRPLVHNGRPVATPNWRIFIIKIESPFRIGRECTESRTFRKIEGKYLL